MPKALAFTSPCHIYFGIPKVKLQMPSLFSKRPETRPPAPFASSGWILGEISPLPKLTLASYRDLEMLPLHIYNRKTSTIITERTLPPFTAPPPCNASGGGPRPRSHSQWMAEKPPRARDPTPGPGQHRLFPEADSTPFLTRSPSCCCRSAT